MWFCLSTTVVSILILSFRCQVLAAKPEVVYAKVGSSAILNCGTETFNGYQLYIVEWLKEVPNANGYISTWYQTSGKYSVNTLYSDRVDNPNNTALRIRVKGPEDGGIYYCHLTFLRNANEIKTYFLVNVTGETTSGYTPLETKPTTTTTAQRTPKTYSSEQQGPLYDILYFIKVLVWIAAIIVFLLLVIIVKKPIVRYVLPKLRRKFCKKKSAKDKNRNIAPGEQQPLNATPTIH